jgi:uncharacterized membrane protein
MAHFRHTKAIYERREKLGFKGRVTEPPGLVDRLADWLSLAFGTMAFLLVNVALFALWIVINVGLVPGVPPFDPFPFNFLTMSVSLEAIVLSVVVLISQNFQGKIADLRSELDFEVNVRAEREITKLVCMMQEVQEHLGMAATDDADLVEMEKDTDLDGLKKSIEEQSKAKPDRKEERSGT